MQEPNYIEFDPQNSAAAESFLWSYGSLEYYSFFNIF